MRGSPTIQNKSNLTLSINTDILKELQNDSKKHGTSLNAIVNKILSNYVMFGKYFAQRRPMIMAPELFKFHLQELSYEHLYQAWILALNNFTPQIFAMHNLEDSLDNYLKYALDDIGLQVGAWDNCTINHTDDEIHITIKHGYGQKWSKSIAASQAEFIQNTFKKTVTTEIFEDIVKLRISNQ